MPDLNKPTLSKPTLNNPKLEQPLLNKPTLNKPTLNKPLLNTPLLNKPLITTNPTEYARLLKYNNYKYWYKNSQQPNYLVDYNDPTQINSFADVLGRSLKRMVDPKTPLYSIFTGPFGLVRNTTVTLKETAELINRTLVKPILAGQGQIAGINLLQNLGETMDAVSNPIKAIAITTVHGGNLKDIKTAFLDSLGLGDNGRKNFDWDTGYLLADIALEILSDPSSWVSLGGTGMAKTAGKKGAKTLTKTIATKADDVAKFIVKNLDDITEEGAQRLLKTVGKEIVGESAEKSAKEILSEITENELTRLLKNIDSVDLEKFTSRQSRLALRYGDDVENIIDDYLMHQTRANRKIIKNTLSENELRDTALQWYTDSQKKAFQKSLEEAMLKGVTNPTDFQGILIKKSAEALAQNTDDLLNVSLKTFFRDQFDVIQKSVWGFINVLDTMDDTAFLIGSLGAGKLIGIGLSTAISKAAQTSFINNLALGVHDIFTKQTTELTIEDFTKQMKAVANNLIQSDPEIASQILSKELIEANIEQAIHCLTVDILTNTVKGLFESVNAGELTGKQLIEIINETIQKKGIAEGVVDLESYAKHIKALSDKLASDGNIVITGYEQTLKRLEDLQEALAEQISKETAEQGIAPTAEALAKLIDATPENLEVMIKQKEQFIHKYEKVYTAQYDNTLKILQTIRSSEPSKKVKSKYKTKDAYYAALNKRLTKAEDFLLATTPDTYLKRGAELIKDASEDPIQQIINNIIQGSHSVNEALNLINVIRFYTGDPKDMIKIISALQELITSIKTKSILSIHASLHYFSEIIGVENTDILDSLIAYYTDIQGFLDIPNLPSKNLIEVYNQLEKLQHTLVTYVENPTLEYKKYINKFYENNYDTYKRLKKQYDNQKKLIKSYGDNIAYIFNSFEEDVIVRGKLKRSKNPLDRAKDITQYLSIKQKRMQEMLNRKFIEDNPAVTNTVNKQLEQLIGSAHKQMNKVLGNLEKVVDDVTGTVDYVRTGSKYIDEFITEDLSNAKHVEWEDFANLKEKGIDVLAYDKEVVDNYKVNKINDEFKSFETRYPEAAKQIRNFAQANNIAMDDLLMNVEIYYRYKGYPDLLVKAEDIPKTSINKVIDPEAIIIRSPIFEMFHYTDPKLEELSHKALYEYYQDYAVSLINGPFELNIYEKYPTAREYPELIEKYKRHIEYNGRWNSRAEVPSVFAADSHSIFEESDVKAFYEGAKDTNIKTEATVAFRDNREIPLPDLGPHGFIYNQYQKVQDALKTYQEGLRELDEILQEYRTLPNKSDPKVVSKLYSALQTLYLEPLENLQHEFFLLDTELRSADRVSKNGLTLTPQYQALAESLEPIMQDHPRATIGVEFADVQWLNVLKEDNIVANQLIYAQSNIEEFEKSPIYSLFTPEGLANLDNEEIFDGLVTKIQQLNPTASREIIEQDLNELIYYAKQVSYIMEQTKRTTALIDAIMNDKRIPGNIKQAMITSLDSLRFTDLNNMTEQEILKRYIDRIHGYIIGTNPNFKRSNLEVNYKRKFNKEMALDGKHIVSQVINFNTLPLELQQEILENPRHIAFCDTAATALCYIEDHPDDCIGKVFYDLETGGLLNDFDKAQPPITEVCVMRINENKQIEVIYYNHVKVSPKTFDMEQYSLLNDAYYNMLKSTFDQEKAPGIIQSVKNKYYPNNPKGKKIKKAQLDREISKALEEGMNKEILAYKSRYITTTGKDLVTEEMLLKDVLQIDVKNSTGVVGYNSSSFDGIYLADRFKKYKTPPKNVSLLNDAEQIDYLIEYQKALGLEDMRLSQDNMRLIVDYMAPYLENTMSLQKQYSDIAVNMQINKPIITSLGDHNLTSGLQNILKAFDYKDNNLANNELIMLMQEINPNVELYQNHTPIQKSNSLELIQQEVEQEILDTYPTLDIDSDEAQKLLSERVAERTSEFTDNATGLRLQPIRDFLNSIQDANRSIHAINSYIQAVPISPEHLIKALSDPNSQLYKALSQEIPEKVLRDWSGNLSQLLYYDLTGIGEYGYYKLNPGAIKTILDVDVSELTTNELHHLTYKIQYKLDELSNKPFNRFVLDSIPDGIDTVHKALNYLKTASSTLGTSTLDTTYFYTLKELKYLKVNSGNMRQDLLLLEVAYKRINNIIQAPGVPDLIKEELNKLLTNFNKEFPGIIEILDENSPNYIHLGMSLNSDVPIALAKQQQLDMDNINSVFNTNMGIIDQDGIAKIQIQHEAATAKKLEQYFTDTTPALPHNNSIIAKGTSLNASNRRIQDMFADPKLTNKQRKQLKTTFNNIINLEATIETMQVLSLSPEDFFRYMLLNSGEHGILTLGAVTNIGVPISGHLLELDIAQKQFLSQTAELKKLGIDISTEDGVIKAQLNQDVLSKRTVNKNSYGKHFVYNGEIIEPVTLKEPAEEFYTALENDNFPEGNKLIKEYINYRKSLLALNPEFAGRSIFISSMDSYSMVANTYFKDSITIKELDHDFLPNTNTYTLGTLDDRNKLIPGLTGNLPYSLNALTARHAEHLHTQEVYTQFVLQDYPAIKDIPGASKVYINEDGEVDRKALQKFLLTNPDLVAVEFVADDSYKLGYRMDMCNIYSDDIVEKIASDPNIRIMPYADYEVHADKINNFDWDRSEFLKLWHNVIITYKKSFLFNIGTVFRNVLDSGIKMIAEGDANDLPESLHNLMNGYKLMSDFDYDMANIKKMDPNGYFKMTNMINYFENTKGVYKPRLDADTYKMIYDFTTIDGASSITQGTRTMFDRFMRGTMGMVEDSVRLGQYLNLKEQGYTYDALIRSISATHFNYNLKSKSEIIAELFIPFYSFNMRNINYMVNYLYEHPKVMQTLFNVYTPIWNFDELDHYELGHNASLQYQIISGNIPLKEIFPFMDSDMTLKVGLSLLDTINLFADPVGNILNKLAPPIQLVANSIANYASELVYQTTGNTAIMDFVNNKEKYSGYFRGTTVQDLIKNPAELVTIYPMILTLTRAGSEEFNQLLNLVEKYIPLEALGTLSQRYLRDGQTYYERTGNPLNALFPELFGATKRYTPKTYSSGKKNYNYNTYKKKSYSRKYYKKATGKPFKLYGKSSYLLSNKYPTGTLPRYSYTTMNSPRNPIQKQIYKWSHPNYAYSYYTKWRNPVTQFRYNWSLPKHSKAYYMQRNKLKYHAHGKYMKKQPFLYTNPRFTDLKNKAIT